MTGSPVLARYVSENASRCGLMLALYSRPHSSECAVNEHRAIIAALAKGDAARATALMNEHLEAVAGRALIVPRPTREPRSEEYPRRYAAGCHRRARESQGAALRRVTLRCRSA